MIKRDKTVGRTAHSRSLPDNKLVVVVVVVCYGHAYLHQRPIKHAMMRHEHTWSETAQKFQVKIM